MPGRESSGGFAVPLDTGHFYFTLSPSEQLKTVAKLAIRDAHTGKMGSISLPGVNVHVSYKLTNDNTIILNPGTVPSLVYETAVEGNSAFILYLGSLCKLYGNALAGSITFHIFNTRKLATLSADGKISIVTGTTVFNNAWQMKQIFPSQQSKFNYWKRTLERRADKDLDTHNKLFAEYQELVNKPKKSKAAIYNMAKRLSKARDVMLESAKGAPRTPPPAPPT